METSVPCHVQSRPFSTRVLETSRWKYVHVHPFLLSPIDAVPVVLTQMFRSSSGVLAVWATLLFASFVYIGPILLISLLIAVLTDTYDRVRAKEKAELRKLRLRIVASCQLSERGFGKRLL